MYVKKVMMLGDAGVGKTSLTERFVNNRFTSDYKVTIGVDIFTTNLELNLQGVASRVQLVIWDTDGDIGASIFESDSMRGASGALIVGDLTRGSTQKSMGLLAE